MQRLAFFARTSSTPPVDKRGKQPNPHATSEGIKKQIHQHIKSFPTAESRYSRSTAVKCKRYLSAQLSVACMHEMYLEMYEPDEFAKLKEGHDANPMVKYDFSDYFNTHFNLSFGVPKTNTCSTCDELNVKIRDASDAVTKQTLEGEKQIHLHASQEFYTELRGCTKLARQNPN